MTNESTDTAGAGLRRRWYALTDDGDWTELESVSSQDWIQANGVSFLSVDLDEGEDLFEVADVGEGVLLGRVVVVHGMPMLLGPESLVRG
jgi:hypothetical protein